MDLFSKLSDSEKNMMEQYIDAYALEGYSRVASLEHILRIWNENKQTLFRVFGEQLTLSKHIVVRKGADELADDFDKMFEYSIYHDDSDPVGIFYRAYQSDVMDILSDGYNRWEMRRNLGALVNTYNLATNVYDGETFEIPTPKDDSRPIKVAHGCKVTRVLGKIAQAFDLPCFEEFRIAHSQILNQKSLEGDLTISIHPLDYMTMSDNNSGWTSCMSWEDNGCYRQGTVEMMNSPMVVVAYLRGSEDMRMPGGWKYGEGYDDSFKWVNKKWRELFIVTEDVISNIKGYPYRNENLSSEVIKWLRDLMVAAGYPEYTKDVICYNPWCDFEIPQIKTTVYMDYTTGYMYNDFDSNQYAVFGVNIDEGKHRICYSGESECMACGSTYCDFDGEGALIGDCCASFTHCDCCEDRYSEDELTYVDGCYYCDGCLGEYCGEDARTGELHRFDDMTPVYLANSANSKYNRNIPIYFYDLDPDKLSKFFKNMRVAEENWSHIDYVIVDDCTDEGLELFGYSSLEDAIEDFKEMESEDCRWSPLRDLPAGESEMIEDWWNQPSRYDRAGEKRKAVYQIAN